MEKIKLHLGCGSNILDGYINIDKYNKKADRILDVKKLDYKNETIDEIFTSHMIEHVFLSDFLEMLKEWKRVLKKGGNLYILCPNIKVYMNKWLQSNEEYRQKDGINCILGNQNKGSGHLNRNFFTANRLRYLVEKIGFFVQECKEVPTRTNHIINGDIFCKATKEDSLSVKLDEAWIGVLKKKNKRHTIDWYLEHPITKELLISDVLHGNVIDIGCGLGYRTFIVSKHMNCNVTGIDGSAYAIQYAKKHFILDKLKFVTGDVTSMSFLNDSFDNAYMLAVIEHIDDIDTLIKEIKRVVVKNGKILISVTENDYHSSPDHVHIFSKDKLHKTLTLKGFEIISSFVESNIIFMVVKNV